jgi:hypothetical protein
VTLGQVTAVFRQQLLICKLGCSLLKFKGGKYFFRAGGLAALTSLSGNRKKNTVILIITFAYGLTMYVIIIIKFSKIKPHLNSFLFCLF